MKVGVVIVNYNTPEHLLKAVNSVVDYVDRVFIVDLSDQDNEAYHLCDELFCNENISGVHVGENIGHGPGLNLGIEKLDAEYIICMDSDAELKDPLLLQEMVNVLQDEDVYGCGSIDQTTDEKGWYLYLPFCMFKREMFYKFHPFVHSGGPFEKTMKEIKGKKRIVEIPGFMDKVSHEGKATRRIAGDWRSGFGGRKGI